MYFKMFVIDVSIIYENSTYLESKRNFNGTGFHVFYIILFIYRLASIPHSKSHHFLGTKTHNPGLG